MGWVQLVRNGWPVVTWEACTLPWSSDSLKIKQESKSNFQNKHSCGVPLLPGLAHAWEATILPHPHWSAACHVPQQQPVSGSPGKQAGIAFGEAETLSPRLLLTPGTHVGH